MSTTPDPTADRRGQAHAEDAGHAPVEPVLRLVQDVAWLANRAEGLESAVRGTLDLVADHFGWPVGWVWMPVDGAGGPLRAGGWWHPADAAARFDALWTACRATRLAPGAELAGRVLTAGHIAWRRRLTDDPPHGLAGAAAEAGLHFAVAVPVPVGRGVAAVLEWMAPSDRAPDDATLAGLADLGVPLGHVIERQALVRRLADLSLDEHQHLGRELHDTLGQQLTGLGLMARTLVKRLRREGSSEVERAELLAQTADEAKRQVRALIRNVMPVEVDADGLMAALSELAEVTEAGFAPRCAFACDRHVPLDDNFVATQLYLIAQEAVHNAVKHADARRIVIRLGGRADGGVTLGVQDDGRGLPAHDPFRAEGMGLRIMRHRAGLIGAELDIAAGDDGTGTAITCRLPGSD